MTETQSRTIVKTVTFRILATLTTMVIVYAFTKRVFITNDHLLIKLFYVASSILNYNQMYRKTRKK
jgi:hypothetical protein